MACREEEGTGEGVSVRGGEVRERDTGVRVTEV
jgi:hypothetical protein